jgi:hypothetical protein
MAAVPHPNNPRPPDRAVVPVSDAVRSVKVMVVETATGAWRSVVVPSPTCPDAFHPQQ